VPRPNRSTHRAAAALVLLAGASLACAGGKKKDGDDAEAIDQDPACATYLECLTATAPDQLGPALEAYGEDGSCWTSASTAEACAEACEAALDTLAEAFPSEPACGGAGGDGLDGTYWTFTAEDEDNECGYPWGVLEVEGDIDLSGDGFELDGTVTAHNLAESREAIFDARLGCTLSGRSFACDPVDIESVGNFYSVVELTGTFGDGFTTAEATAVNRMQEGGTAQCEATTLLSGTSG